MMTVDVVLMVTMGCLVLKVMPFLRKSYSTMADIQIGLQVEENVVDDLDDRWVGIKMVVYDLDDDEVKLELWVDDGDEENDWEKATEYVDDGDWEVSGSDCDRDDDDIIEDGTEGASE